MSKLNTVLKEIRETKVRNASKFTYASFYFLTRLMSFSLRRIPFVGRLVKWVFEAESDREFIIENNVGTWSVTPFNDTMTISAGYFERELSLWPYTPINKRVCIDIGANIGRYTIAAAKDAKYEQVLAIEPNPKVVDVLNKNIKLNNVQDIVIVAPIAITNTGGESLLQNDTHHFGGGNLVDPSKTSVTMDNSVKVRLSTLDALLKEKNIDPTHVDFIKIDVEGLETEVLEGMEEVLNVMPQGSCLMIEISNNLSIIESLSRKGFIQLETSNNDHLFQKTKQNDIESM